MKYVLALFALLFSYSANAAYIDTGVFSPPSCLLSHELAHAGGWGPSHPGAVKTKECGHLPMQPKAFPLPKGMPVHIHYIPGWSVLFLCGPQTQACTWPDFFTGGAVIYLPIQPGTPVGRVQVQ